MLQVFTALLLAIFVAGVATAQEPNIGFEMKPRPADAAEFPAYIEYLV
jgi:hypothetical protein